MQCTMCDAEVPSDATFCIECGARMPAASSAGARTVRISTTDVASTTSAPPPMYPTPMPESYAVQPYAPHSYAPPIATAPQTSTPAIISLVFGILAWSALPLLGAIVAIVAGHLAQREIHASGDRIGGRKLAMVGLILGYAQLVLPLIVLLFALLFSFPLIR